MTLNIIMKSLINYLDYFKKSSAAIKARVSISWSKAISVDKLFNGTVSQIDQQIADQKDVVYIFVGENTQGEKAIDVGQTSNSLLERTKQHLQNGDYLEGYPKNQKVYCGKVSAGLTIGRELLEQLEGIIIQYLVENENYHLCNDAKIQSFHQSYKIGYIENINRIGDLGTLLPPYLPVED